MTPQPRFTVRQLIASVGFAMAVTCVLAPICYAPHGHPPNPRVIASGIPIFLASLCVRVVAPGDIKKWIVRGWYYLAVGIIYSFAGGLFTSWIVWGNTWISWFLDSQPPFWFSTDANRLGTALFVAMIPFALICFGFIANHMIRQDSTARKRPDPATHWSAGSGI